MLLFAMCTECYYYCVHNVIIVIRIQSCYYYLHTVLLLLWVLNVIIVICIQFCYCYLYIQSYYCNLYTSLSINRHHQQLIRQHVIR